MTGLEKITGKILSDAQARADEIIAAAEAEADRIALDNQKAIDGLRAASAADADARAEGLRQRAASAAENRRRNILLVAKNEVLDSAFEGARQKVLSMTKKAFLSLWGGILASVILDMENERREAAVTYGEELTFADAYLVGVNEKDGKKGAEALIAEVKKRLPESVIASRLCPDETPAQIGGGCILTFGAVSMNCSVESVLAERRRACEGKVCSILFEKG